MVANVKNGDEDYDYKRRYKTLKRKLGSLIAENESFQEILHETQEKLLKASRDRSFLLDRLLQYEKADMSSSDSDETDSSDGQESVKSEVIKPKVKKESTSSVSSPTVVSKPHQTPSTSTTPAAKKRKPPVKVIVKQDVSNSAVILNDGHMTPEEVERHLESRQSYLDLVPERTPLTVPTEMFSNEPSLDSFCYSESNEVGDIETSPSLGEEGLSVELP